MLRSNILNNEHWIKKILNIKSIKLSDLFSTQNVFNYYLQLLSQQVWPTEWPSLAELKHKNSLLLRDTLLFQHLIILWREANKGFKLNLFNQGLKRYKYGYVSSVRHSCRLEEKGGSSFPAPIISDQIR